MKNLKQIGLLIGFISVFMFNCTVDVADGTGHDWETKVIGFLQDKNGAAIDSATVWLLPATYIPMFDSGSLVDIRDDSLSCFSTMTDKYGAFRFSSIQKEGTYIISSAVIHPDTLIIYYPNIEINENGIEKGDSIHIGSLTAKNPARIIFHDPDNLCDRTGMVYIRGTQFKQRTDSIGAVAFKVPAETLDIHYTSKTDTGTVIDTAIVDNISLTENEDIIIGGPVPVPVLDGPDTVVVDSSFTFQIMNFVDTLLYRLVWVDGDTTSWTHDSLFTYTWNDSGLTTIYAQACKQTDVSKVSEWSEGKLVIIMPTHTISQPNQPWTTNNTILVGDTTVFFVDGAESNYNHPVQYQFDWGDTIMSTWVPDTMASHTWDVPGTYYILARARSAVDTTVTSIYSDSLELTVLLNDTFPPVFSITGNNPMYLEVNDTFVEPVVTAWDDVDGDLTDQIQSSGTVNTAIPGTYIRSYSVSDNSGNEANAELNVHVVDSIQPVDTIPPVITLLGDNPMYLDTNDTYIEPGATASDNFDGDISGKIQISGIVNTGTVGTYTRTYSVSDSAGNSTEVNRTVQITDSIMESDTTPPVITLFGDNPMILNIGDTYNEPGATAFDSVDGDISDSIDITGTVNTAFEGTDTVFYFVSDNSGNGTTEIREVYVNDTTTIDSTPPVITLLGDNPMDLNTGDVYNEPGATAFDNFDGDISHKILITGVVDTSTAGVYVINYHVTDSAGNSDSTARTVNVSDSTFRATPSRQGQSLLLQNPSINKRPFNNDIQMREDRSKKVTRIYLK